MPKTCLISLTLLLSIIGCLRAKADIFPGKLWPDNRGIHINAHGGGVMKYQKTYYWFGEHKADSTNSARVGGYLLSLERPQLMDLLRCGVGRI